MRLLIPTTDTTAPAPRCRPLRTCPLLRSSRTPRPGSGHRGQPVCFPRPWRVRAGCRRFSAPNSFDAVCARGIGGGAINRMAEAVVPVYVHRRPRRRLRRRFAAFRSGSLLIAGADNGCSGSGFCGGDGHHHDN